MNRTLLIVLGVVVVLIIFLVSGYNGLVSKRATVDQAWADVQAQYQRRSDLIGNLVNTIKGSADFEKSTLTAVIEARAKATSVTINAGDLNEDKLKQFQAAQSQVSSSLSRLLVSVEKYPDLQTTQQFRDLSAELAGTENRINKARTDYNGVVKAYNVSISQFPAAIYAGMFGFKEKPFFQADAGAEKAPTVKF